MVQYLRKPIGLVFSGGRGSGPPAPPPPSGFARVLSDTNTCLECSWVCMAAINCSVTNRGISQMKLRNLLNKSGCFFVYLFRHFNPLMQCGVQPLPAISFFLSLYTARPSFEYYRQVYFVHSGLQDESLQVTISKLP